MLWTWTIDGSPADAAAIHVRDLLEMPVEGSWVHAPLQDCHLDGEVLLERPCDLKRGFHSWARLSVGAFTYAFSHIGANVGAIGRYCSIADNVVFGHFEHPVSWLATSSFQYQPGFMEHFMPGMGGGRYTAHRLPDEKKRGPILIGNDVWIGASSYIKAGSRIGNGAIVGTHAVVTKDVPPYAIVAGNPARIIRFRFPPATIRRLLLLRWWRYAFTDFEGLDPTDVDAAITRMEQLIDAGMRPYRPPVTRIVGDGQRVRYAALEPPHPEEAALPENELPRIEAETMPKAETARPAWRWPWSPRS